MSGCDAHPEAGSPWPYTEDINPGAHVDTCADWSQTESNTLQ